MVFSKNDIQKQFPLDGTKFFKMFDSNFSIFDTISISLESDYFIMAVEYLRDIKDLANSREIQKEYQIKKSIEVKVDKN